jgi:transcriptional antiterminator RfaH
VSYWACAMIERQRETLALEYLRRNEFQVFYPRLCEQRVVRHRKVVHTPPLFPGYIFVSIVLGWHRARWSPGVSNLIMDGVHPARVPDAVIAEIRQRERNGYIVLPRRGLAVGDSVRVVRGPLRGLEGLVDGMRAHERVAILLAALGRIVLPKDDVVAL